jgi:hypothetical protein
MVRHPHEEKTATQVKVGKTFEDISGKMPVFKCWCGTRILVVPDLFEMAKAIKKHQIEHKRLTGECISEDALIEEILNVIVET